MIIRLTKLGNPVLINFDNVTSCEVMENNGGRLTKVWLIGGTYINVEESLEDILNLQLNYLNGTYQDTTCITQPIQERLESTFNRRPRVYRKNNYEVQPENQNRW